MGGVFGGGFVVGIDPLPLINAETGRVEFDALASQLQQRVVYVQARGEELPFKSECFSVVVCDNVLDHVENPDSILIEANRVLKAGGHLILGVNCFSILGIVKWRLYATKRFSELPGVIAHPHSYLKGGVVKAVSRVGFIVCAIDHVPIWKQGIGHQYRFYLIGRKGVSAEEEDDRVKSHQGC
jgi:SAM-dependent methyltransferase